MPPGGAAGFTSGWRSPGNARIRKKKGHSGPLDHLDAIAGRINGDADDDAGIAEWTRLAGHESAGGLDGADGRGHIFHVEDDVRDGILNIVGIAMHEDDWFALVGLGRIDGRSEVDEHLRSSWGVDPIDLLHA